MNLELKNYSTNTTMVADAANIVTGELCTVLDEHALYRKKADGTFEKLLGGGSSAPVGTIISSMATTAPDGYLLCDGSTFDTTLYPNLYMVLNSNKLPDLRETALVGTGQRGSGVAVHDTYNLGQFKDDQTIQTSISYNPDDWRMYDRPAPNSSYSYFVDGSGTIGQRATSDVGYLTANDWTNITAKALQINKIINPSVTSNSFSSLNIKNDDTSFSMNWNTSNALVGEKSGIGISGVAEFLNEDLEGCRVGSSSIDASGSKTLFLSSGNKIKVYKDSIIFEIKQAGSRVGTVNRGKRFGVNYFIRAVSDISSTGEATDIFNQIKDYITAYALPTVESGTIAANSNIRVVGYNPDTGKFTYNALSAGNSVNVGAEFTSYNLQTLVNNILAGYLCQVRNCNYSFTDNYTSRGSVSLTNLIGSLQKFASNNAWTFTGYGTIRDGVSTLSYEGTIYIYVYGGAVRFFTTPVAGTLIGEANTNTINITNVIGS